MERQAVAGMAAQTVLEELHTTAQGLDPAEVAQRHSQYGRNVLTKERATALGILGRQFKSALIYFLIVAAVLSFASQDLSDGVIITVIILLNTVLGFSQEYRSERAVESLSRLISHTVLVTRA